METAKNIAIIILLLLVLFLQFGKTPEQKVVLKPVNYVKDFKKEIKPYMDTIQVLQDRIAILKKQRSGVNISRYKELVEVSIVKDSSCQPVVNNLLNEVAKRDTIIDLDSLQKMNLEKQILIHASADSLCVEKLEQCQTDLDDAHKEIGRFENKNKVKNIGIAILSAIALIALIF